MQNFTIGFFTCSFVVLILLAVESLLIKKTKPEKIEEYEAIIDDCGFKGIMWTLKNSTTGKILEDVWDYHFKNWNTSRLHNIIAIGLTPLPEKGSRRYKIRKEEAKDGSVQITICVSPEMDPTPKAVGTIIANAISNRS